MEHFANVNAAAQYGITPLHTAVLHGHVTMVRLLCLKGVGLDLDAVTNQGQTSLHLAVKQNQLECFKALLMTDADRDCFDDDGFTPADVALQCGQRYMRRLLVRPADRDANIKFTSSVKLTCRYRDTATIYRETATIRRDTATIYRDTAAIHRDTATIYRETATDTAILQTMHADSANNTRATE